MSEKYPRTPHMPQSPGGTRDDRRLPDLLTFVNRPLVFTEKLDGSNVCLEKAACYARSHSHPPTHPSFDAFKALHARLRGRVPERLQIFGEWLYAKHSIHYTALDSYLQLFAVRDKATNEWLSWDDVKDWSDELKVPTVPLMGLFTGLDEKGLERYIQEFAAHSTSRLGGACEGFCARWADRFHDNEFEHAVAKWVRAGHVQSDEHWMHQELVRNQLAK